MTLEQRFWAKVDKSGDCWLWTAGKTRGGYGAFHLNKSMARAHRVAYMLAHGPVADNVMIDHKCHIHACVRPKHLRPATRKQNAENLSGPPRDNTSGVQGVGWVRHRSKWRARVVHNGATHSLGHFANIVDAEAAVVAKRNELFTHNDKDRIG